MHSEYTYTSKIDHISRFQKLQSLEILKDAQIEISRYLHILAAWRTTRMRKFQQRTAWDISSKQQHKWIEKKHITFRPKIQCYAYMSEDTLKGFRTQNIRWVIYLRRNFLNDVQGWCNLSI